MLGVGIFLVTLAYAPGVVSSSTAGRWVVVAVWGAALAMAESRDRALSLGHWIALALLAWCAASLAWSVSPYDTAGQLLQVVAIAPWFAYASRARSLEGFSEGLAAGVAVNAVFVVLQRFGLDPVQTTDVPGGLFLSRNASAEIAAVSLVLVLAHRQWLLALPPALVVACSASRGALLGLLVAMVVLVWVERSRRAAALVAIPACVVIGVAYLLRPELGRLDIWDLALENLTLLGRGLNSFGTLAPLYEYAHSEPLQVLFELGPLGLALATGIVVYGFWNSRDTGDKCATACWLGSALVSFPLHHPVGATLLAVLAGRLCVRNDRSVVRGRVSGERASEVLAYAAAGLRSADRGWGSVAARSQYSVVRGAVPRGLREDQE